MTVAKIANDVGETPDVHRRESAPIDPQGRRTPCDGAVDRRGVHVDDPSVGEYALVTAVVASLALSLATIPESQLARQLPVTLARAQALVSRTARAADVPPAQARAALARAPYRRTALRYLYAEGWIGGRKSPSDCVFAKATPASTRRELGATIRRDAKLVSRLRRMDVSVAQAVGAIAAGTASAC